MAYSPPSKDSVHIEFGSYELPTATEVDLQFETLLPHVRVRVNSTIYQIPLTTTTDQDWLRIGDGAPILTPPDNAALRVRNPDDGSLHGVKTEQV